MMVRFNLMSQNLLVQKYMFIKSDECCAVVVKEILQEASPGKKRKLSDSGLLSTPTTAAKQKKCEEIVGNPFQHDQTQYDERRACCCPTEMPM